MRRGSGASQALVLLATDADRGVSRAPSLGRPSAGFLAQLIVSSDPALRPSRSDRTQVAAAIYAETARRFA